MADSYIYLNGARVATTTMPTPDGGTVNVLKLSATGTDVAQTEQSIGSTYSMETTEDGYNASVVTSSPARLMTVDAYNARAGGVTIAFYDRVSVPTVGQEEPKWSVYLPPLSTTARDYQFGIKFAKGIAFALIPDDAAGLMAGDVRGFSVGFSV